MFRQTLSCFREWKCLLFRDHWFSSINCPHILYHWIVSNTKYLRWDGIIQHWWKLSSLWEELRHSFDLVHFIFELRYESQHLLSLLSLWSLSIYVGYRERTSKGKKSQPRFIRKLSTIFMICKKMLYWFTFSSDTLSDCRRGFYQKQGRWMQAARSGFGCFDSCKAKDINKNILIFLIGKVPTQH